MRPKSRLDRLSPLRPLALAVALPTCLAARSRAAQTYTCAPTTTANAISLHEYTVRLVTASIPDMIATRDQAKLPATTASTVSLVTRQQTCAAAAAAYHAAVSPPGTPAVSRSMLVVQVGSTHFVVSDPAHAFGHYDLVVVFDSRWTKLSSFTG